MKSTLSRERTKIKTNLEGIRRMEKMPGLMFIVDTRREKIAVKEAKKLGVTTMALIDTDSDPDLVDLPIPGNDDAMKAIEVIMAELADAALEGKKGRAPEKAGEGPREPRRRSSRSSFRADDGRRRAPGAAENAPGEGQEAPAPAPEPAGEAPTSSPLEGVTA
jgi:small subunit ribosomal protein S2